MNIDRRRRLRDELIYAFHFAATYLERGFSVIPMCGKRPAIPWKEYQRRRADLDEIRNWFGKSNKKWFNIGIVTGKISELIVIDTDSQVDAEFWQKSHPETPLQVRSGSEGGIHFYYRISNTKGLRNQTRVLNRLIDIRAESGVIVAPPSIHPKTARPFRWVKSIECFDWDAIPSFDSAWIQRPGQKLSHSYSSIPVPNPIKNVRAWIRKVRAVAGQNGHSQTFKVACKLRDAGLSPDDALLEITRWSEDGCADPPWSHAELVHKINSAFLQRADSKK